MKKENRQSFILSLINEKPIGTQDQLVYALHEAGYHVTQATVSRDIKALELEKVSTDMGSVYRSKNLQFGGEHKKTLSLSTIFENSVTKVVGVDYFIVIHTLPGAASTVAFHLDSEENIGILGTIAGDDTILVILDNKEKVNNILELFKGYL
ncbi:hypothetical protein AZF37_04620 [endosymbiont 'TC1' of Trimyema compressum]|uniref:arginine repressor n=1 Tax=endosymbiont 'TC1' of Trimyema compressum TaxID=243899 RepID=UPI0007F0964F|nr:arginine repressor [endosymbiont 'TC1' of Trimyema compressum]AMP20549.1 hypothetical protein AZF37_04620 [endosymbiont 'TC1' of Trimyema compressum]